MQQCMGFRMLRVSDPRISDALVLWGRWSPTRATPMRLFVGDLLYLREIMNL